MTVSPEIWTCELGLVPYEQAYALQDELCEQRINGQLPDTILLLEHPPVVTRGRRGQGEATPADVPVVDVDRGGKLTYHGPGQLVAYPIVGVDDVVGHVRMLEQAIVAALAHEGIAAHGRSDEGPDYTGVWVKDRKIASIGVHVRRSVATHGLAVNVDNDLAPFDTFTPCGLASVQMTSVARELGVTTCPRGTTCVGRHVASEICRLRGARQRIVGAARLPITRREAALAR